MSRLAARKKLLPVIIGFAEQEENGGVKNIYVKSGKALAKL
jgi:hypothetical protein